MQIPFWLWNSSLLLQIYWGGHTSLSIHSTGDSRRRLTILSGCLVGVLGLLGAILSLYNQDESYISILSVIHGFTKVVPCH